MVVGWHDTELEDVSADGQTGPQSQGAEVHLHTNQENKIIKTAAHSTKVHNQHQSIQDF